MPIVIATIGMFGCGAVGLLTGGIFPGRLGMAASITGLGVIQAGILVYFLATSLEPSLFLWVVVPALAVEGLLAFWLWPRGNVR